MIKINRLKTLLKKHYLDAYIIPKNDEFFGEYAFPNRLKTVSNFSGSAGFSIVTNSKNYLFVDGRYLIQSKIESGKKFKIVEIPYTYPKNILDLDYLVEYTWFQQYLISIISSFCKMFLNHLALSQTFVFHHLN